MSHRGAMRWDELFATLDARFDELRDAEEAGEQADRQRVEAGSITTGARLAGAIGTPVRVRLSAGLVVSGVLRTVGPDWLLFDESPGREALVRLGAVTMVEGLSAQTGLPVSALALKLDLRRALRGIARDRSPVALALPGAPSGTEAGAAAHEITGTVDRVGADFVELALHAPWEARRASAVRRVVLVPLTAVQVVRPMPWG